MEVKQEVKPEICDSYLEGIDLKPSTSLGFLNNVNIKGEAWEYEFNSDIKSEDDQSDLEKEHIKDESLSIKDELLSPSTENLDDVSRSGTDSEYSESEEEESELVSGKLEDPWLEQMIQNTDEEAETSIGSSQGLNQITECNPLEDLGEFKQNGERRKGNKKKDFCMYCESYVLNFARHVFGAHRIESSVQKIISLPAKDPERRKLLNLLRRKGNFLNSSVIQKPVRKLQLGRNILPCTNCKGFYASKQLWRHRKKCMGTTDKLHQAKGQNLLLKNLEIDKKLMDEIFPRMRPDEISMVAKSDPLICAFGKRYYESHREKHFVNVTSRKMRELARLLIEIRKIKPSIKNFLESLKTENFDILIQATKNVAQYNEENKSYGSASTALNLGTEIKNCAQIAILFVLNRKEIYGNLLAPEAEADLKTLIELIDSEWKFKVSIQALNDLNVKKWNKMTMLALASDVMILNEYLLRKAQSTVELLKINRKDQAAYTTLLETVFCRVLLLNRRRPGVLQKLPLNIYGQLSLSSSDEEFSNMVAPAERILLCRFKRIVIRDNGRRGVPVLFSPDIEDHIQILLTHRRNFLSKNNTYLFGNPDSMRPLSGYKIIKKYATLSGAKNARAIAATTFRKHLATLTQVLNMSENDMEHLSTLMGHTTNIHHGSYRFPDDIYLVAKISKLLLLMEKGEADQYKGKTFDEICVNLDIDSECSDSDDDQIIDTEENNVIQHRTNITPEAVCSSSTQQSPSQKSRRKRILVRWTAEQKKKVIHFFTGHIKKCRPPKKYECFALKETYPGLFENKDWRKIKAFVHNEYKKKRSLK